MASHVVDVLYHVHGEHWNKFNNTAAIRLEDLRLLFKVTTI